MTESRRFISPALFLLAALCFFLPFVSFTCQGQTIATVSGMELITGTKIEKFEMEKFDDQQTNPDLNEDRDLRSEPLAVAAFIFALCGIIVSLIPHYSRMLSIITGALGALMLLFLRSSIGGEVTGDFDFKIIEVSYEWGYYLSLIFFISPFALNLYNMITENRSAAISSIGDLTFSNMINCPECGTSNSAGSIFCSKCGHTLINEGNF
ncbi:MAG TPA: zinc ribbon domain-containing protein [Ignavibacteriaceae bacterium]|nr:zinc ribbon domain-containing protein [Ignavibacteriaceae bacterium]